MRFFQKIVALFLLVGLAACSNEFDLTSEWKDIPVVYGILDVNSNTNYLRVEKAFLDPRKSALEIAQIADSLYYDEGKVQVYLENVENGQRIDFQRVNAEDEGIVRTDAGIFAVQPNYIYKGIGQMQQETDYKVVVERADNSESAVAEFETPGEFLITKPFLNTAQGILLKPDGELTVEVTREDNSQRYNATMEFVIQVKNETGTQLEYLDTLRWLAVTNVKPKVPNASQMEFKLKGEEFYKFIGDNAKRFPDQNGIDNKRRDFVIGGLAFSITAGGKELEDFEIVAQANSGISGAEAVPYYSNVVNGLGVVTSKFTIRKGGYIFNPAIYTELGANEHTKDLGFQ